MHKYQHERLSDAVLEQNSLSNFLNFSKLSFQHLQMESFRVGMEETQCLKSSGIMKLRLKLSEKRMTV